MNPPRDDRVAPSARRAATVLFFVGWFNFLAFAGTVLVCGGHALDGGTAAGGRYYFDDDGTPREVSRFAWNFSYAHAVSVCVTQPLASFGAPLLMAYARRRDGRQM